MEFIFVIIVLAISGYCFYGNVIWPIQEAAKKREAQKAEEARKLREANEEKRFLAEVRLGKDADAIRFYNLCLAQGIRNLGKEADRARLALFTKNKGIPGTEEELESVFKRGQRLANREETEKRLWELRTEEQRIDSENRKYIGLTGRDKLVQTYVDAIAKWDRVIRECDGKSGSVVSSVEGIYRTTAQKEGDWAVAGGIASGLAGGAAGVATALDVQQKNAQIRANNAALSSSLGYLGAQALTNIASTRSNAEASKKSCEQALEKARNSLVEERPGEELMSYLSFRVLNKRISETGVARIKVGVKQARQLLIYGEEKARVDGSIKVLIKSPEGETVAEGMFVLPNSMLSEYTTEVICHNRTRIPRDYTVEFAPNNLWGIEE